MTTPPDQPNWRAQPAEYDQLCDAGARQLHGPQADTRDTETVHLQGSYL